MMMMRRRELVRRTRAMQYGAACAAIAFFAAGCAQIPGAGGARSTGGSQHQVRFKQPPEPAARCFARNAEAHSSALMSEVIRRNANSMEVIVRVKNGVTYATADIERDGAGSRARLMLNVVTSGSRSDLLHSLTQGC
jgi:hypothetical protein